jgi:glycosyltransferase involved in cell wall biosynthesis
VNHAETNCAKTLESFRTEVCRRVPSDAIVAVVSKGDPALLDFDGPKGWHFPRRADGVYAGYHPGDSQAAIAHLEELRANGAGYLAFPPEAVWWLDHYAGFREHLERRYALVLRDTAAGVLYGLDASADRLTASAGKGNAAGDGADQHSVRRADAAEDDLRDLVDVSYYAAQTGEEFASPDEALGHYLEIGHRERLDPHPLFDARWYLSRYPHVREADANPLLHFLEHSITEDLDPNPYFDTQYYYAQREALRDKGINALVHYLAHGPRGQALHPNPLFRHSFYVNAHRDVPRDSTPLAHYLHSGWREGRFVSPVHRKMLEALRTSSRSALVRGNWKRGAVLFFWSGERDDHRLDVPGLTEALAAEYRLDSLVVATGHPSSVDALGPSVKRLVLEDYRLAADVLRPSALRLLARSLSAWRPLLAISEIPEVLPAFEDDGIGSYFLLPGASEVPPRHVLEEAFERAARALVPSSDAFHAAAEVLGRYPTNVAMAGRQRGEESYDAAARWLLELATRDFGLDPATADPARAEVPTAPTRRIIIPCADWGVSGVNASLEALGRELVGLGWDVEILFTRDEAVVRESAHDAAHLPRLPHRYLHRNRRGVEGMWEALIADVEQRAPCILFMSYDFLANSVASALTDRVGVVTWVQADDGDYYEQVYRLGLSCNAVVCVSERIRERVAALNPVIGERAHAIPNSSVSEQEIVGRRPRPTSTMRIVYSGRLVQYQKRILDFIALAHALDRTGVPYEISLIGSFSPRESARETFEVAAREHLDDGRIRLPGRMSRDDILQELTANDFFVLLSDFEGFPLALVEAMARGCVPVVAHSESGIPELIASGENGLIVTGRDYDEWARTLAELWADRRRLSGMSRKARTTVRRRFTAEQMAEQFDALFRQIADDLSAGTYHRPPALTWGPDRSPIGDVLPPPPVYRPGALDVAGLR